jgi:hypothetical protein
MCSTDGIFNSTVSKDVTEMPNVYIVLSYAPTPIRRSLKRWLYGSISRLMILDLYRRLTCIVSKVNEVIRLHNISHPLIVTLH